MKLNRGYIMAKFDMELDDNFISKLFELTDACPPSGDDLNLQALKKQLYELGVILKNQSEEIEELKTKLKKSRRHVSLSDDDSNDNKKKPSAYTPTATQKAPEEEMFEKFKMSPQTESTTHKPQGANDTPIPISYSMPSIMFVEPSVINHVDKEVYDDDGKLAKGCVLIIDDLGVVTYQLSVLFKHAGYLPVTSKEIYEAVDKFKRNSYDYVIMDLFIPTEREGFILLEELKKIATSRNDSTVIGVMSASSRKDHKQICQKHGAAFYIEKVDDWQRELFKLIMQYSM